MGLSKENWVVYEKRFISKRGRVCRPQGVNEVSSERRSVRVVRSGVYNGRDKKEMKQR